MGGTVIWENPHFDAAAADPGAVAAQPVSGWGPGMTGATTPAAGGREEVVTTSHLRLVDLPGTGTVALITLDNGLDHTRPSTFGAAGLASLNAALDAAVAAEPVAIAVTGKPFVFAVGADLTQIGGVTDRETAVQHRGARAFDFPSAA